MANNFSTDLNCIALWRMENGALTTDSIGGNTLTAVNSPTANTTSFKEGASSVTLVSASNQYLKLLDANADADFPLRTGDTTLLISMCGWVYPTTLSGWRFLFGKTSYNYNGRQGIGLGINGARLYIHQGWGVWGTDYNTGIDLALNTWQHITLIADGKTINGLYRVLVWNDSTLTYSTFNTNPPLAPGVGTQEFRIGFFNDNNGNKFNGYIDEVVVFNDLLTDEEAEDIKDGTFGPEVPTVVTNAATDITDTSATGNGEVTTDGGATITERGFCWSISANPTTADDKVVEAGTTGVYAGSITGLSANTMYHYRAYATNSIGTAYGADYTISTVLAVPTVITSAVTDIGSSAATANGYVVDAGGGTILERGFAWGTAPNPTITADNKVVVSGALGGFTGSLVGLSSSVLYHVRAYAVNEAGIAYGADVFFTSLESGMAATLSLVPSCVNPRLTPRLL